MHSTPASSSSASANEPCAYNSEIKKRRKRPGPAARKQKRNLDFDDGIMPQPGKFKRVFNSMKFLEQEVVPIEVSMDSLCEGISDLSASVADSDKMEREALLSDITQEDVAEIATIGAGLIMVQRIHHARKGLDVPSSLDFCDDMPLPAFSPQRPSFDCFGEFMSVAPPRQFILSDYESTVRSLLRMGVQTADVFTDASGVYNIAHSLWYPTCPNDRRTISYICLALQQFLVRGNRNSRPPPLDALEDIIFSGRLSFPYWFMDLVYTWEDPWNASAELTIDELTPLLLPIDTESDFFSLLKEASSILRRIGLQPTELVQSLHWDMDIENTYRELATQYCEKFFSFVGPFNTYLTRYCGPGDLRQFITESDISRSGVKVLSLRSFDPGEILPYMAFGARSITSVHVYDHSTYVLPSVRNRFVDQVYRLD